MASGGSRTACPEQLWLCECSSPASQKLVCGFDVASPIGVERADSTDSVEDWPVLPLGHGFEAPSGGPVVSPMKNLGLQALVIAAMLGPSCC